MKTLKIGTRVTVSFLGETLKGIITGKTEDGYNVEVFRSYMKNTHLNSVKTSETKGFSSFIISHQ